ncbi:hypothetical protein CFP56_024294 [Quercus suber]|uniref:Uncharacterized protein n=1 Tax=Quercus suber TaxID=58331 RepID=A0AAW0MDC3_QUESU
MTFSLSAKANVANGVILHNLGALKIAFFRLGLLGYTPVEFSMCITNSLCVENIFNAVTLFNDRVVTLGNDFNNNLTSAKFIDINTTEITLSITGAYIHFGMQFIQLKSDIWSMGKEHIELCPQLMLIHMTSNASLRPNEQDDV